MLYGNINYLKFRDIIKLSCAPPTNPRPIGQGNKARAYGRAGHGDERQRVVPKGRVCRIT